MISGSRVPEFVAINIRLDYVWLLSQIQSNWLIELPYVGVLLIEIKLESR
jgi:hypothetical protein